VSSAVPALLMNNEQLVDVYEDANNLHLVTELCTGGELFDRYINTQIETYNVLLVPVEQW
jgi:hypothetical protein